MTLAALRSEATIGQTLTLAGPKAWTVPEVITLCEKLADERAQVTEVRASRPGPRACSWERFWAVPQRECTTVRPGR